MIKNTVLLFFICASITCMAQKNPCDTDIKNFDYTKENTDTTITLNNGTQLTFNRCEFFDIRDCIEYKELRTIKDLQSEGITTMDRDGNVLLSCGMFILKFSNGDCTKECLSIPFKVRIPMLSYPCIGSNDVNRLYSSNSKGVWQKVDQNVKEVKDSNGINYFEFYAKCGGGYNCDRKLTTSIVKFKAKKFKALVNLNLSSNCPILNLNFTSGKRKNIIYAKIPCVLPDSLMLKIDGEDKSGNTITVTKKLSECKPKFKATTCGIKSFKLVRNILGIFKTRERNIYGKYILD